MLTKPNEHWTLGTYIGFYKMEKPKGFKTEIFQVWTKNPETGALGTVLGDVRWFGAWRKYSFMPYPRTVYEETCMEEIIEFIKQETKSHRERKKNAANV